MAKPTINLILAVRRTIIKLKHGAHYEWGHMGACNCGNLAQELTNLSKAEIHAYAMQRHGDWNEQLVEYCPTSGYPMDLMISKMLENGCTLEDLMHLENLSDPAILQDIPKERRDMMCRNSKGDVILYMNTWLKQLETKWVKENSMDLEENSKKINFSTVLS